MNAIKPLESFTQSRRSYKVVWILIGLFRINCTNGESEFQVPTGPVGDYCDTLLDRAMFGLPTKNPGWTFMNMLRNGITFGSLGLMDKTISIIYPLSAASKTFFKWRSIKNVRCDFQMLANSKFKLVNRNSEVCASYRLLRHLKMLS